MYDDLQPGKWAGTSDEEPARALRSAALPHVRLAYRPHDLAEFSRHLWAPSLDVRPSRVGQRDAEAVSTEPILTHDLRVWRDLVSSARTVTQVDVDLGGLSQWNIRGR